MAQTNQWLSARRVRRAKANEQYRPTPDRPALDESPIGAATATQLTLDQYAAAEDFSEPVVTAESIALECQQALAKVQRRLKEVEHEPERYFRARGLIYTALADRWTMLAASYQSDVAIAKVLMDMAMGCEKIALANHREARAEADRKERQKRLSGKKRDGFRDFLALDYAINC